MQSDLTYKFYKMTTRKACKLYSYEHYSQDFMEGVPFIMACTCRGWSATNYWESVWAWWPLQACGAMLSFCYEFTTIGICQCAVQGICQYAVQGICQYVVQENILNFKEVLLLFSSNNSHESIKMIQQHWQLCKATQTMRDPNEFIC